MKTQEGYIEGTVRAHEAALKVLDSAVRLLLESLPKALDTDKKAVKHGIMLALEGKADELWEEQQK